MGDSWGCALVTYNGNKMMRLGNDRAGCEVCLVNFSSAVATGEHGTATCLHVVRGPSALQLLRVAGSARGAGTAGSGQGDNIATMPGNGCVVHSTTCMDGIPSWLQR